MHAVVLLDSEPRFRRFPFALSLDAPVERAVVDARDALARTEGRFDGPIAFCHGVTPEGVILRRAGRYAQAMVVFQEPTLAYRLGFALGVQLFVEREEGVVLFQLRGPSIGRDPLLWTASASGGVRPGEDPRAAVLADAVEETGSRRATSWASARWPSSSTTIPAPPWSSTTRPCAPAPSRFRTRPRWPSSTGAVGPTAIGAQVSGDTLAAWSALEAWREAHAAAPA